MFGKKPDGEDFLLMYVTAENSGEQDKMGYTAYCAVKQIKNINEIFSTKTIQRIYYKNDGIEKTFYQTHGWGWPASLLNADGGWYYMFSSRYRTKKEFSLCEDLPESIFADNEVECCAFYGNLLLINTSKGKI